MSANLENSAVSQDWKRSVFIPIPKKGNAKECSNYCTIALISHISKAMLKSFKLGVSSTWTKNFQIHKLGLEKAKEPEIKWTTFVDHGDSKGIPEKYVSLTMLKPLTVWITINCGKFLEMGVPHDLTCLLRNLYAGQEATVRNLHGTMDWFKTGKGVRQGCIL